MHIQFDTKDVHRALEAATRASTPPAVTEALVAAMAVYQKSAQDRAPVASGDLKRSIQLEVTGPTSVSVGTDSPYSLIQEFGGTIRARKKKLMFSGRSGIVFIRRVKIHAQPYFLPAFDSDTPSAEEAFGNVFDRNFTR